MLTEENKKEVIKQCFELENKDRNIETMRKLLLRVGRDEMLFYDEQEFYIEPLLETTIEMQEVWEEYNNEVMNMVDEIFN